jgi:hypothetical protein
MSETPFFKTRMGQRYYERTMPELVKQLERLNELLERLLPHTDSDSDNMRFPGS